MPPIHLPHSYCSAKSLDLTGLGDSSPTCGSRANLRSITDVFTTSYMWKMPLLIRLHCTQLTCRELVFSIGEDASVYVRTCAYMLVFASVNMVR